jgi:hypothetical protein
MPRETNVPYHQNVYDLLDLEPGVCPVASRMIADHEAEFGPLPASVREWYCVPNMVPLVSERPGDQEGTLWFEYSNAEPSEPLADVLGRFGRLARGRKPEDGEPPGSYVMLKVENQAVVRWWIELDESDDPAVLEDQGQPANPSYWDLLTGEFSEFARRWILFYHGQEFTPLSARYNLDPSKQSQNLVPKPNETTHWLCTPATPYPVPLIDFLTDTLGEPTVRTPSFPKPRRESHYTTDLFGDPIPARTTTGVSQFTFPSADGLIRLTTDNLDHPSPHAAWWVAGHTREAFERLRGLLVPWNCFGPVVRTSGDASR